MPAMRVACLYVDTAPLPSAHVMDTCFLEKFLPLILQTVLIQRFDNGKNVTRLREQLNKPGSAPNP